MRWSKPFMLGAALFAAMLASPASSVAAGQAEMDLLSSYIGNWRGTGLLKGGERPEEFSCRMSIAKGAQTKINYAGRCSLVGLNLSVSGTIAYIDTAGRYEAAMTSNTRFSGVAIGVIRNSEIYFDLKERAAGAQGDEISIGSQIRLKEDQVTVQFDIEFSDSGQTMSTSVPFRRVGS